MALSQPLLYTQNAFDATKPTNFLFNVIGGSQVVGNKLTIQTNSNLQTVYSETQNSFQFIHSLPANTLTNGTYYQAFLNTIDSSHNISPQSNTIQFYCYSEPSFEFSNIPVNHIINNSNYNFEVVYNQTEGETLNAYVFNLYDVNKILISTSGTQYVGQSSLPTTISYLFSGFENNTTYYIECNGVTLHNMQITTGQIEIVTSYEQPTLYTIFSATNNCQDGYVTLQSNVVNIVGTSYPSDPVYINNEELDLTQNNSYVTWTEGYEINDEFTLRIWGRNFIPNSEIFQFSNVNGDNISLSYCTNSSNAWFELKALSNGWQTGYVIQSNQIDLPENTEQIFIWIRRINNLYDLIIDNLGVIS